MGTFSMLKNPTDADKLVKFKQHTSLIIAHKLGKISDEHYKICSGGACAGFAMSWLSMELGVVVKTYGRDQGIPAASVPESVVEAEWVAPQYAAYSKTWDAGGAAQALEDLAQTCGLGMNSVEFASGRDVDEIWIDIKARGFDNAHEGCYISTNVTKGNSVSGHALGFRLDEAGDPHFFDPNVGEYRIKNWTNFWNSYKQILRTSFQSTITVARAYSVWKA